MPIDRKKFFDTIRMDLFAGTLSQQQVDGMDYLLDTWEKYFSDNDIRWLAYALATTFHETDQKMVPIEEYDKSQPYAQPKGEYGNCYYGRGHVMLTHPENYQKGEAVLKESYSLECPMYEYPHRMLEDEPSALVLFDGSIYGWFTGVGLPQYFNEDTEDPYNARRVINGTDKADLIAGYYWPFKKALT